MTDQLFELRDAGDKGKGLFAVQDIKRGTRIIAEEPLVHVSAREDAFPKELYEYFGDFSPEEREQFNALHCPDMDFGPPSKENLTLYVDVNKVTLGPELAEAVKGLTRMQEIWLANAVDMGGGMGAGVFPDFSRLNHSCRPNVQNHWNPTLDKLTVHAIRDIAAGEELLTSYVYVLNPKEERQSWLQKWGFTCECEVCSDKDGQSEKRRERMTEIDLGLEKFHMDSKSAANIEGNFPKNETEALQWAEEMVKLMKEEQLFNMVLAKAYRACSNYSLMVGYREKAIAFAKKELEIELNCVGEETDDLNKKSESARHWVEHLENMPTRELSKVRANWKRTMKEKEKAEKKAAKKAEKAKK